MQEQILKRGFVVWSNGNPAHTERISLWHLIDNITALNKPTALLCSPPLVLFLSLSLFLLFLGVARMLLLTEWERSVSTEEGDGN